MSIGQFQYIEGWQDENDLLVLPISEDDQHEYKRSAVSDTELGNKISIAASAFWNTGGGIFVAGINEDTGMIDGGISVKVGRQSRIDWVDQYIMKTVPPGPYLIQWIDTGASINPNCGVLVIAFGESPFAHTAYDYKYYLRLGAHSQGANHYLVEAIKARKVAQTPLIRALLQRSRRSSDVVELAILVVNDAVALNVHIDLEPIPLWLGYHKDSFPLQIPLIDQNHPFTLALYAWGLRSETFGKVAEVKLIVDFEDAIGRKISYTQNIDVVHNMDPMTIGDTDSMAIMNAVLDVSKQIKVLNKTVETWRDSKVDDTKPE